MAAITDGAQRGLTPLEVILGIVEAFKERALTVFCGAGISANSGIPMATQLVAALASLLPCAKEDLPELLAADLPFEAFLQILSEGAPLDPALRVFRLGKPSLTHQFLAKLVSRGYLGTICTTNFDLLLERALAAEGLRNRRDYARIYKASEFASFSENSDRPHLIKIHGSIDHPETIAAMISSVAARLVLPEQSNLMSRLFSGESDKGIIVIGYSGSDKFDLTPQLRAVRENYKAVVLVRHVPDVGIPDAIVSPIAKEKPRSPWAFMDCALELSIDANLLVKFLWNKLLEGSHELRYQKTHWRKYISQWSAELNRVGTSNPHRTVGRLFEEIGDMTKSSTYFNGALELATQHGDSTAMYKSHGDLGRVANLRADYYSAIAHGRRALSGARQQNNTSRIAAELGNLGLAFYHLGRYRRAVSLHRRSWYLARKIGAQQIRANQLGNMGLVYRSLGRYKRSAGCHLASVRLNHARGNIRQEAGQLGNLGLCFKYLGDLDTSESYHNQALTILEDVGNLRGVAIEKGSLGTIRQQKHDYRSALQLFRAALAGARQANDRRSVINQLNSIAEVLLSEGKRKRAATVAFEALQIAIQTGHRYSEGMTNVTVARCCVELGDIPSALDHAEKAATLMENLVPNNHPYRKAAIELVAKTSLRSGLPTM